MTLASTVDAGRISTTFDGTGSWRGALEKADKPDWWRQVAAGAEDFFVDYGAAINLPSAIADIPALVNVLPLIWLSDTTLYLDSIDSRLAAALPFIKARYKALYPELDWRGKVEWRSISDAHIGQATGNPLALFSGGVDAVFTALANVALRPTLMTVWGADMFFHDVDGWNLVKAANRNFADRLGLDFMAVQSTFRTSLNYGYLDGQFGKPIGDVWWHAYQVGPSLGAIGLPAAFARGADTVFLASGFSKKDPYISRSGTDAVLVQEVRAAGASVKLYDFNLSRQDKVRFICDFRKRHGDMDIPLHVCWRTRDGKNCGKCEKCVRTKFALMGCNSDPSDFGFDMSDVRQDEVVAVIHGGNIKKTAFWKEVLSDLQDSKFARHRMARALLESPH